MMLETQQINAKPILRAAAEAEELLWRRVRDRQMHGVKFHQPEYGTCDVVSYYAPDVRLVVELNLSEDCDPDTWAIDPRHDRYLHSMGLTVVRFCGRQVVDSMDWVLDRIRFEVAARIRLVG